MPYQSGTEKRYFPTIIAALIIIVAAIGFFIWRLITGGDNVMAPAGVTVTVDEEDGTFYVNPGDDNVPDSEPFVPEPTAPPTE